MIKSKKLWSRWVGSAELCTSIGLWKPPSTRVYKMLGSSIKTAEILSKSTDTCQTVEYNQNTIPKLESGEKMKMKEKNRTLLTGLSNWKKLMIIGLDLPEKCQYGPAKNINLTWGTEDIVWLLLALQNNAKITILLMEPGLGYLWWAKDVNSSMTLSSENRCCGWLTMKNWSETKITKENKQRRKVRFRKGWTQT